MVRLLASSFTIRRTPFLWFVWRFVLSRTPTSTHLQSPATLTADRPSLQIGHFIIRSNTKRQTIGNRHRQTFKHFALLSVWGFFLPKRIHTLHTRMWLRMAMCKNPTLTTQRMMAALTRRWYLQKRAVVSALTLITHARRALGKTGALDAKPSASHVVQTETNPRREQCVARSRFETHPNPADLVPCVRVCVCARVF